MGIFEEIKERRELRKAGNDYYDSVESAQRTFENQVDTIKAIRGTDGFREIINYFERESDACKTLLLSSKSVDDIKKVQVKYEVVSNFISFLTSRIDYEPEVINDDDDYQVEQL